MPGAAQLCVRCHVAALVAIACAFVIGFVLRARGWRWWLALAVSWLVVPTFVLGVALLQLQGSEWWPVAIIFGSMYGAASGALGVVIAAAIRRT